MWFISASYQTQEAISWSVKGRVLQCKCFNFWKMGFLNQILWISPKSIISNPFLMLNENVILIQ